jgi:hypothetical protein
MDGIQGAKLNRGCQRDALNEFGRQRDEVDPSQEFSGSRNGGLVVPAAGSDLAFRRSALGKGG